MAVTDDAHVQGWPGQCLDDTILKIAKWLETHAHLARCRAENPIYARSLARAYCVDQLEHCSENDFLAAGLGIRHARRAANGAARLRAAKRNGATTHLHYHTDGGGAFSTSEHDTYADDLFDDNTEIRISLRHSHHELSANISLIDLRAAVTHLVHGLASARASESVTFEVVRRDGFDLSSMHAIASEDETVAHPASATASPVRRRRDDCTLNESRTPKARRRTAAETAPGNDLCAMHVDATPPKQCAAKPLHQWTPRDVSRWLSSFEALREYAPTKSVDGRVLLSVRSRSDVQGEFGIRFAMHQRMLLRELNKLRGTESHFQPAQPDCGKRSLRKKLPPIGMHQDDEEYDRPGGDDRGIKRRPVWSRENDHARVRLEITGPAPAPNRSSTSQREARFEDENDDCTEMLSPNNRKDRRRLLRSHSAPHKLQPGSFAHHRKTLPGELKNKQGQQTFHRRSRALSTSAAGPSPSVLSPRDASRDQGLEALGRQVDLGLQMDLAAVDKDAADQHESSFDLSDGGTLLDWRSGLEIKPGSAEAASDPANTRISGSVTKQHEAFPKPIIPKADRIIAIAAEDLVIFGELGRGACASVRKALHMPSLSLVAVKMVAVHDDSRRRQLLRELAALHQFSTVPLGSDEEVAKKSSPSGGRSQAALRAHIVAFHGAFTNVAAGCVCAVLEYMDARSVHDAMEARNWEPFDVDSLSVVAHGCVAALAALHADRQLHRDVKPSNVLLDWRWRVKLSDFGVSRAVDNTLGIAQTYVGTLTFMAPERIVGSDYSFHSDIWSVGLCLATMALGRVPLPERDGYWAVVRTICDGDPPSLDSSVHDVSLCNLTNACLSRSPADRPAAAELLDHNFVKRGENKLIQATALLGTPHFAFPIWHRHRRIQTREAGRQPCELQPERLAALTDLAAKAVQWKRGKCDSAHWKDNQLNALADQLHVPADIVVRIFAEEARRLSAATSERPLR